MRHPSLYAAAFVMILMLGISGCSISGSTSDSSNSTSKTASVSEASPSKVQPADKAAPSTPTAAPENTASPSGKPPLSPAEVKKAVDEKLKVMVSTPSGSSNPFSYIEGNKQLYNDIVSMGAPAFNYLMDKFKTQTKDGLESWISAKACTDILGERNNVAAWSSGRDWYSKFVKLHGEDYRLK